MQSCLALGEGTCSELSTARTINRCPRGRGWDGSSRTRALGCGPHEGPVLPPCSHGQGSTNVSHMLSSKCQGYRPPFPIGPSDASGEDNSPLGLITECKELHLSLNFHSVVSVQTTILMLKTSHQKCLNNNSK